MDNSNYKQFNVKINHDSVAVTLDTSKCFDESHSHPEISPIDRFNDETVLLNKKLGPSVEKLDQYIFILGYISLVESYLRETFRKLINVDKHAQSTCEQLEITYGAAVFSHPDLLPESILEKYSFASPNNIKDALKSVLGVKGGVPENLDVSLDEFHKVCQMRHCIVHRFGYLGSNNLIKLGSATHTDLINCPLKLEFDDLQAVASICNNLVRDLNNFLFKWFLAATINFSYIDWSWDMRKDKKTFLTYFNIFYSSKFDPDKDTKVREVYNLFRSTYQK